MAKIHPFFMPKWGIEMTEGTVAEWMVAENDTFKRGQTLCLIETDKITNEVEAEYEGIVRRVLVPAGGDPQPVGTLLAVFSDADTTDAQVGEFIAGFKITSTGTGSRASEVDAQRPAAPGSSSMNEGIKSKRAISPQALHLAKDLNIDLEGVEGSGRGGKITYQDALQASRRSVIPTLKGTAELAEQLDGFYASPLAKRLASVHGVNLSLIVGTGPRGRISKSDVMAMVRAPTLPAKPVNKADVVPMDKIRKVISRRLTEAKQNIPHIYLRTSVKVDALLALRKSANLILGIQASINDYLLLATAKALARHRDVNVQVHDGAIHHFPHADVAIAIASPKGLVAPIVHSADLMRIDQIALTTHSLIETARLGKLSFEDLNGGTFTISNLGMHGIEQFDAIINPPQGAILAVGAIMRVLCEVESGKACFESRMTLCLSCDHRAIDGVAGARFMTTLKQLIEEPESLFAHS